MSLFIAQIDKNKAFLSPEESHHMSRVLRMKVDDSVYITNGKGLLFKGKIESLSGKMAVIGDLKELENTQKRNYQIQMIVAPTKQIDRIEFFLEKAVEIGLDDFFPIITFNSERRKINQERLEKIAVSAMKQSLKAELPKVHDLQSFEKFLKNNHKNTHQKFIAHCHSDIVQTEIKKIIKPEQSYQFLIGPEGDFSKAEVQLATENGFTPISLGNQRMRTETAALSCVNFVHWLHL